MLSLPNITNTPPGGWVYDVPETNKLIGPFSGWSQLRDVLTDHYKSTGYPMPPNLFDLVETQICEKQSEYCGGESTIMGKVSAAISSAVHTYHAAHRCLVTLVSNRGGGGEKPSQELAEARAAVCVACPENRDIAGCNGCNIRALNGLVERLAGAKKTESDDKLKYCAVCHCNLRAKIWTKHEAIWKHMKDSEKARLPTSCWLVTETIKETS